MELVHIDQADKNMLAAEEALPAHLMFLMAEQIKKTGYDLRADILGYLNAASAAPFTDLPTWAVQLTARKVDDVARSILTDLSPDNPRMGFMACCFFALKLVDEGLLLDQKNQAVMISLLLVEESRGQHAGDWDFGEAQMLVKASDMLRRAQLQGLYLRKFNAVRAAKAPNIIIA